MANRVLITGHGGFVGHHCLEYFLEKTDWEFICIDSFRHKGTISRIVPSYSKEHSFRIKSFVHDLTVPFDYSLENLIFDRKITNTGTIEQKPINHIINIASESAVERSIHDPINCINNNWHLAVNMLEFARKCPGLESFIHISTDEVYGEAPPGHSHVEWSEIVPSNPYAASKAAQEALCISYWRTYDLPIIIINCMNIIGERQDKEKFIPKIIGNILTKNEMPIYGDSEEKTGTRKYLYAKNLADAILFIIKKEKPLLRYSNYLDDKDKLPYARPMRFNVCGDEEISNLDLAKKIAEIMGMELKYKIVPSESARPGYDRRYSLNGDKLKNFGWNPPFTFTDSLTRIINWYKMNVDWVL